MSFVKFNVRGVRHIRRKLVNAMRTTQVRTALGVWEAGLMLQRQAQKLSPVVTGNLKASAYTEAWRHQMGPAVEVGFTAVYAAVVHENPRTGTLGYLNPKPPGKQRYSYVGAWHFLGDAVALRANDIVRIIVRRAGL